MYLRIGASSSAIRIVVRTQLPPHPALRSDGQCEFKGGPTAGSLLGPDPAILRADDAATNCQSQTGAWFSRVAAFRLAEKRLEDPLGVFRRNAQSMVFNPNADHVTPLGPHDDADRFARRRILGRIVQQVGNYSLDL